MPLCSSPGRKGDTPHHLEMTAIRLVRLSLKPAGIALVSLVHRRPHRTDAGLEMPADVEHCTKGIRIGKWPPFGGHPTHRLLISPTHIVFCCTGIYIGWDDRLVLGLPRFLS